MTTEHTVVRSGIKKKAVQFKRGRLFANYRALPLARWAASFCYSLLF
jgi:hypothetical protein